MREKMNWDWKFYKGDAPGAEAADYKDGKWQSVNVPHDYSIEGPVSEDGCHFGGFFPHGVGWYRKEFSLKKSDEGKRVLIEFEGVFRRAHFWVNGEKVGYHHYGYTGVVFDITDNVRFGGAPNILAVKIDNPDSEYAANGPLHTAFFPAMTSEHEPAEGWWYEGCGVYRNVWLMVKDELRVAEWGTFVTTPEVSEKRASLHVRTSVRNDAKKPKTFTLETDILDPDGKKVATLRSRGTVKAGGETDIEQTRRLASPRLWSVDSPQLYRAVSRVIESGETRDEAVTDFGVRWFEFTCDRGFFLNGRPLRLRGGNIHQDFGALGVGAPDRAHEKTIETLKAMGANTVRMAHNDAAPALYEACDRLGMLCWAETRYLLDPTVALPPLRDLIRRNRNHPSIICWGLANTSGDPHGRRRKTDWLQAMHDLCKKEDPTRPTAIALEGNADSEANGFSFVPDVVGLNGSGQRGRDELMHDQYPEFKLLISEYSAGPFIFASNRGSRGEYANIPGPKQKRMRGAGHWDDYNGAVLDVRRLCRAHELQWSRVALTPWHNGGLMWSIVDYYGETTGWPVVTSQFGPIDICRFPKDTYYYYQQEWTDEPMVHIFPHWNVKARKGETVIVWCYSNCDTVELFLNGKSLGERVTQPLSHIEWQVPYEKGTLEAKARIDGKIVCKTIRKTAGLAARLRAEADRAGIRADNDDLSFVTIQVEDAKSVAVPTADNEIKVSVTGPGRLIGLSAGDPRSHTSPRSNRMKAYNGLLMAIVQSAGKKGNITVKAEGRRLKPARVVIKAS